MRGALTRRAFMARTAVTSAAIASAGVVSALEGPSDLEQLIEAHRLADLAWVDADHAADLVPADRGDDYEALCAARDMAIAAEESALLALLSYRPASLDDLRETLA